MTLNIRKLKDTDPELAVNLRKYVYNVQGACQDVHSELGPYLNEYMYQDALAILLQERGIEFKKEY